VEDGAKVGKARCAVRAAFSGAIERPKPLVPPAAARAETSQRDVPTRIRFRGRGEVSIFCGRIRLIDG